MVAARPSASNTQQYPIGDSKYPARLAQGSELPQLKPVRGAIGPYELCAELGSGGMGTVYVARRTYEVGVTRTIALKTLRQDLSSEADLVEMFLDEARITARISHPHVCSVMDIGTHRGVPYVTMDYLIGEPLSRLGPLMADDRSEASLANIVRVIANLCEGLHAAHELRDESGEPMHVVHRDISPDNLFVLYDGSVRVADFGIALTAAHQKDGRSAGLAGKSGYMSPEQLRGLAIDRRADLWAMGVVLWEMLAGKRLFRAGNDVAATVAVLEGPIPPPSRFHAEVPKGLDAVVMRALERDRDKRYPTARAMASELEQVLARCFGPVSAGQVSTWLDEQFPGCQDFRRTIVARAEELREQVDKFEFDPNLGILVSTRPPENDQVSAQLLENVRRMDSLADVDVQFEPNAFIVSGEVNLDGFAPAPVPSIGEQLKFPEPPPAPLSFKSLPSPKRKMIQAAIVLGMLGLGAGVVTLFAREEAPKVAAVAPVPAPKAQPQPEPVPAAVEAPVEAPVVAQPPIVDEPPAVATAAPIVEAPSEAPVSAMPPALSAEPPRRHHRHHDKDEADEEAQPSQKLGEIYAYAKQGGSYELILRERIVKAPALLKLPIGTETIGVRKEGERVVRQVEVTPTPGRPQMVRIDL